MFTSNEFKDWWKKNWKYVAIGAAGGVVGGIVVKNCLEESLALKEAQLDRTISDARSALNHISSRVDSVVKQVYESEAKKAFQSQLQNLITDGDISEIAKKTVRSEVSDIVKKTAEKAVDKCDIEEVVKNYIDDNSGYFNTKIVKCVQNVLDVDWANDLTAEIKSAVEEVL